ncbi:unnamed protein product [Trichogramma brassicae]|uniref:Uncharacterized protein n=1 Tax=Trichogramma brassicae TaxID=86971 RepID=A0A6H5I219_9HYME|nr:unnamed protein product [Trichogramma brassicae]
MPNQSRSSGWRREAIRGHALVYYKTTAAAARGQHKPILRLPENMQRTHTNNELCVCKPWGETRLLLHVSNIEKLITHRDAARLLLGETAPPPGHVQVYIRVHAKTPFLRAAREIRGKSDGTLSDPYQSRHEYRKEKKKEKRNTNTAEPIRANERRKNPCIVLRIGAAHLMLCIRDCCGATRKNVDADRLGCARERDDDYTTSDDDDDDDDWSSPRCYARLCNIAATACSPRACLRACDKRERFSSAFVYIYLVKNDDSPRWMTRIKAPLSVFSFRDIHRASCALIYIASRGSSSSRASRTNINEQTNQLGAEICGYQSEHSSLYDLILLYTNYPQIITYTMQQQQPKQDKNSRKKLFEARARLVSTTLIRVRNFILHNVSGGGGSSSSSRSSGISSPWIRACVNLCSRAVYIRVLSTRSQAAASSCVGMLFLCWLFCNPTPCETHTYIMTKAAAAAAAAVAATTTDGSTIFRRLHVRKLSRCCSAVKPRGERDTAATAAAVAVAGTQRRIYARDRDDAGRYRDRDDEDYCCFCSSTLFLSLSCGRLGAIARDVDGVSVTTTTITERERVARGE